MFHAKSNVYSLRPSREDRVIPIRFDLQTPNNHDNNSPPPSFERPLSSWKEIAAYVGKGVRTVQRWAIEHEFPVRRPGGNLIIAIPSEIDAWIHREIHLATDGEHNPEAELATALTENEKLRKENAQLRDLLKKLSIPLPPEMV